VVAAGGTLHVVHVMPHARRRLASADAPFEGGRARTQLRALCDELAPATHARIRPVLLAGDPVAEILAFARLHAVDLLVCGSVTPPAGAHSMHVGTVASALFRAAPCSVLVARQPGERWEVA
jgi:nucleotide-binding universal stress UspA family protein